MEQLPDLVLQIVAQKLVDGNNSNMIDALSVAATCKWMRTNFIPHVVDIIDPENDYDKLMVCKYTTCVMIKDVLKKAGLPKSGARAILLQRLDAKFKRNALGFTADTINIAKRNSILNYRHDLNEYMMTFGIDLFKNAYAMPCRIDFPISLRKLKNTLKEHFGEDLKSGYAKFFEMHQAEKRACEEELCIILRKRTKPYNVICIIKINDNRFGPFLINDGLSYENPLFTISFEYPCGSRSAAIPI